MYMEDCKVDKVRLFLEQRSASLANCPCPPHCPVSPGRVEPAPTRTNGLWRGNFFSLYSWNVLTSVGQLLTRHLAMDNLLINWYISWQESHNLPGWLEFLPGRLSILKSLTCLWFFLKENLNNNNYYFKNKPHNLPYLGHITSDSQGEYMKTNFPYAELMIYYQK
jgi:hypothetical protein